MIEWAFQVPELRGSAWEKSQRNGHSDQDMMYPRVGIYCDDHHPLWLCGSFVVDPANLQDHDRLYWSWQPKWLSGDGWLFDLMPDAPRTAFTQSIVHNAPYDADKIHERLTSCAPGSAEASEALGEYEAAQAQVLGRYVMQCGQCRNGNGRRYRRAFKPEQIQLIASTFWVNGIREVPIRTFAKRVDCAAK